MSARVLKLPLGTPLARAASALNERVSGPVQVLTWRELHALAREHGYVVVWGPRDRVKERAAWAEAKRQSRERARREK